MFEKSIKKLKDIYDTYKIIVWILPFFGAGVYDRFYNMWGLPDKVESYKEQFETQRSADSARFVSEITSLRIELEIVKNANKP